MRNYPGKLSSRQQISGNASDNYFSPTTIEEVVNLLQELKDDVNILAGGTDLLVDYFERLYELKTILDLGKVKELQEIKLRDDRLEIGAMVTHSQLENSESTKKYFPVLHQAAAQVGSPQIRNRGTVGGNIVTSSPAGDLLPGLIAYRGSLELVSAEGSKVVPAEEFFTGPKQNQLEPGQLLTKVIIPLPGENTRGCWVKVGRRKAVVISSITLALVLTFTDKKIINEVRACLGAVAPVPLRIKELEEHMPGKNMEHLDFNRLGKLVSEKISPIDDIRGTAEYRRDVARDIFIEALEQIKMGVEM